MCRLKSVDYKIYIIFNRKNAYKNPIENIGILNIKDSEHDSHFFTITRQKQHRECME